MMKFKSILSALFLALLLDQSHCAAPAYPSSSSLTYITLEEHYDSKSIRTDENAEPMFQDLLIANGGADVIEPLLQNIAGARLDNMNNNSIRIQVVSNNPDPDALFNPKLVSKANADLASAIKPYPSRFRGMCFLPMAYPSAAATELKSCVQKYHFVGALVDAHLPNATGYGSPAYDVFWSTATKLDVPIYLHPTYPQLRELNGTSGIFAPDAGTYSDLVTSVVSTIGWGWHADTGLQFVKLWLSGVFDRHPNAKIVLGHMGEMVPFQLARIEATLGRQKTEGVGVRDAWNKNVWVTTSGMFSLDPMATLLRTTSVERIMYSVDYPWGKNEYGTAFMTALRASGMVNETAWEMINHGNAEKLLGIK
ncbi:MAG: hypothetical protein M1821_009655 [Bathelium mastoideum]|nr:MAG: hypothetical protein M1821_009655 [Bathelium mastoideum]KAI9690586.1 MAG: hypothetical protein M1822_009549 [Bathelium mastoideum]